MNADYGTPLARIADRTPVAVPIFEKLTRRESEVLKLIADGRSTKEIAADLGISFKTAVCHRTRLNQKFGVSKAISVVRLAIRMGILEP